MLAVAWLTKAPTMGRFAKKGWIDGWKEARYACDLVRPLDAPSADCFPAARRKDTLDQQRAYVGRLRSDLQLPETFRKVYNFTFDYAKTEGQKSMRERCAAVSVLRSCRCSRSGILSGRARDCARAMEPADPA